MDRKPKQVFRQYRNNQKNTRDFELRWRTLCEHFLPVSADNPVWRLNRVQTANDPKQGWKLHVPATILNACDVLEKCAPFLVSRNTLFKAPVSLSELEKINTGLTYDYAQIGKFLTVYPQSIEDAVFLADKLHRFTLGMQAPAVPYDLQYRADSCVYYRYGAYVERKLKSSNGKSVQAIRDSKGNLVPDDREEPKPEWIFEDPFQPKHTSGEPAAGSIENPLETTYRIFRALRQRGKGGVYQAIDLSGDAPRFCIIKEGRRHGEVDWEGCDGFWRVRLEAKILGALQLTDIRAPRLYDTFELEDSFFLAMEFIDGKNLHELLETKQRRLPVKQALKYAAQIAKLIARINAAGWVWRDCKPANIIVTADGSLRPLDFEASSQIDKPNIISWRTAPFSPPFNEEFFTGETGETEDLYALGAVVYYLLTGKFFKSDSPIPLGQLRRNLPEKAAETVTKLLSKDPRGRPTATEAAAIFNSAIS